MKNFTLLTCTLLIIFASCIHCENILFLVTAASHSHTIWFTSIVRGLAKDGRHNITFITADSHKNLPPNVHPIHIETLYDELANNLPDENMGDMSHQDPIVELSTFNQFAIASCTGAFKSKGLQTILNYPDSFKFDLVVYDYSCGPCFLFLMEKFGNPPLISASGFGNPPFTTDIVGGHNYYAYMPFYNMYYDTDMTFCQRVFNTFLYAASYINRNYIGIPEQDRIARENLKMDFPYLGDIEKRSILALVNTDPAVDFSQPLPPNTIPVAGLQVRDPPSPLPKDIESFMNSSRKGVVLFSLGSFLRSDMLPQPMLKSILTAFEQMPNYNFLWKFETDTLPTELPKNVFVQSWLPQNDILAHPRTKAFISHGGLMSTIEASWHGVPIIGIPIVADQHRNIHKSVLAGVAVKIHFDDISVDEIKSKVLTVLETPSYAKNMKVRSQRFRDQKEKPLDRAIWWINWALRNPTPDHIESPTKQLGFIRSNSYDIIGIASCLVAGFIVLICKVLSSCRRKFTKKSKIE